VGFGVGDGATTSDVDADATEPELRAQICRLRYGVLEDVTTNQDLDMGLVVTTDEYVYQE
jgi:hypothetical protein